MRAKPKGALWRAEAFGSKTDAERRRDEISKHLDFTSAKIFDRTLRVDGVRVPIHVLIVRTKGS